MNINKRGNQGVAWANFAVQLLIGIVLFATVLVVCENVAQVGEFNRNSLRPWVSIGAINTINIIEDTLIEWHISVKCYGRSPALNLKISSKLNLNENNPYRYGIKDQPDDVKTFLFPGDVVFTGNKRLLSDLKIESIEAIDSTCRLFLHGIVSYNDFNKKKRYCTWITYELNKPFILQRENTYSYNSSRIDSDIK